MTSNYVDTGNGHLKFRPLNLKYTRYVSPRERHALNPRHGVNSKLKTLRSHRNTPQGGIR